MRPSDSVRKRALRRCEPGRVLSAVNADIGSIDVTFVDETDAQVDPLDVEGIGEIGITGVATAVANAVYNATGKRVRDLPITLDKTMRA